MANSHDFLKWQQKKSENVKDIYFQIRKPQINVSVDVIGIIGIQPHSFLHNLTTMLGIAQVH